MTSIFQEPLVFEEDPNSYYLKSMPGDKAAISAVQAGIIAISIQPNNNIGILVGSEINTFQLSALKKLVDRITTQTATHTITLKALVPEECQKLFKAFGLIIDGEANSLYALKELVSKLALIESCSNNEQKKNLAIDLLSNKEIESKKLEHVSFQRGSVAEVRMDCESFFDPEAHRNRFYFLG
jgi:hypothetical protein